MIVTDTLGHATLADSLNAACYAITNAFIDGCGVLGIAIPGVPTSRYFDEFIPGLVLNFAVNAGWIPRPHEPQEGQRTTLGRFYVEDKYRDWFLGLLDESLSDMREAARKHDDDEEAKRVRTELWTILFDSLGGSITEAEDVITEERPTRPPVLMEEKPPTTPPVADPALMPAWAEEFKATQVPETSADERKALEARYLATHKHPVYGNNYLKSELQWMAYVHPKQWEGWRRCDIANNSIPGQKILALLGRNTYVRSPSSLRRRKRE